jgi:hypothetical protein
MNKDKFKIGAFKIKMKTLFHAVVTISVLCGIIANIVNAVTSIDSLFDIVLSIVISVLCVIGMMSIILEVAKRWRYIGAAIFIGLALLIFLSFTSIYSELQDTPVLIALLLITAIAWSMAGIIVIINRSVLVEDNASSSAPSVR